MHPRLSVVIACRDAEDVLGTQLAALARQECPVPWELLVCDNGSSDSSVELARSWADRLPLRVVVADDVPGAGPARNAGVRAAQGEWIGFCDADDEVGDGWLAALCRALEQHPFVAGRFDGHRLNSARTLRSRALDQQDGLQHSSALVRLPHAGGGNLGIHRDVFLEVGGFDPSVRYLQDTDLCWRVQRAGYPLVFVPDLLVHVRLRATLRGMFRQGRAYGASLAQLERRHAAAAAAPAPGGAAEATPPAPSAAAAAPWPGAALDAVRGALRLARHFLTHRSSLGAQVWQIGWHLGHRS
jgi:glycosyltransferase involved in cell wall biosynthesis